MTVFREAVMSDWSAKISVGKCNSLEEIANEEIANEEIANEEIV